MKAQDILGSPPFIALGIAVARLNPPRFSYWLAKRVAHRMARRRVSLFRTLRENIAQVVGPETSAATLDALAEEAIYHAGRTYVDMFRVTADDYRRGRVALRYDAAHWEQVRKALLDDASGTVVVGPHLSNFDLAAQWFVYQGVEMQALSLANPDRGDRVINWLREHRGIIVTPIDTRSLRLAVERLRRGGVVLTGVDRPVSTDDALLPFFGRPAHMPMGHVRLALQTKSRIVVAGCVQEPDGVYAVRLAGPIEMERTGNRDQDVRHNALRVLAHIEAMIREAPAQWLMFVPVWPDLAPCVL